MIYFLLLLKCRNYCHSDDCAHLQIHIEGPALCSMVIEILEGLFVSAFCPLYIRAQLFINIISLHPTTPVYSACYYKLIIPETKCKKLEISLQTWSFFCSAASNGFLKKPDKHPRPQIPIPCLDNFDPDLSWLRGSDNFSVSACS